MPAPDDPGQRLALIVASSDYADPRLQQLRAPGRDASDLAEVLRDQTIGAFSVNTLINTSHGQMQRGIAQFCRQAGPGDLVLVYLSCHGSLDSHGRLYYAAIDTDYDLLSATAVSSQWLDDQLEDCRARRQILLLDCCYSGAFARGRKGDDALALKERFSGRGKVVLTASGATEYSFEDAIVIGEGVRSVFTRAVVDGLRTGQADRDRDGLITVVDLHHHVYDVVRAAEPRQTPELWAFGAQGDLLVARSPVSRVAEPAALPDYVRLLIGSPRPVVRESSVKILADLLDHADPVLALEVRLALQRISEADLPHIATLARAACDAGPGRAVTQVEAQERILRQTRESTQAERAAPQRQRQPDQAPAQPRDHVEVDLGPAAGVSDRGLRHPRNEDAMALTTEQGPDGPAVVAVVCDGVSSSARPDQASLVAAEAALPALVAAVQSGGDRSRASLAAAAAAHQAVADLQGPGDDETSATTFVSVIAQGFEVTLCWLGDSRAYWLGQPTSKSRLLTLDDAVASPHTLTRWLGGEEADLVGNPERAPHVARFTPPGTGALLICSGGLWNYRPEAADLAALALPKALTDPLGASIDLTKFAIDAGGADNITAVLIPYLGLEKV